MPVAYNRLPLDEPEEEEDAVTAQSCLDALRGALPTSTTGSHYLPLPTAADTSASLDSSALTSRPSCLEFVLRSVPSFRSHSRYSSVPLEDAASDEDVGYEVDSVPPVGSEDLLHHNGDLQLQYDDHLHLLSTAHGVHGVQVPYQTRGVLRRIPAAATRLVRKTKANGAISEGVRVLKKKVNGVRWTETSRLFCRWLLNYKRLLPIVSLVTVIALVSSTLKRTGHLSDEVQSEHDLLMTIKKSLESLQANQGSPTTSSTERMLRFLKDYELRHRTSGSYSANGMSENDSNGAKILVENNGTVNTPTIDSDDLGQVIHLLRKVSSDVRELSEMGNILTKIDKNLDTLMTRTLLTDRRLAPANSLDLGWPSSGAHSRSDISSSGSILLSNVCAALVYLAVRAKDLS